MTQVRIDPVKVAKLFRSETGPVMKRAGVTATMVQNGAKNIVRVSQNTDEAHGHIRDTIVKRFVASPTGAAWAVGSEHPIAKIEHDGSKPHPIDPVRASMLVFQVGGVTVFARHVDHPGTKGSQFLTRAAQALGLKVRRLK